ncbi:MAG: DsbA family protein [Candidatus Woesearchaeota archaeon]
MIGKALLALFVVFTIALFALPYIAPFEFEQETIVNEVFDSNTVGMFFFTDFSCSYCRETADILATSQVQYVIRHFPQQPSSYQKAYMYECSKQFGLEPEFRNALYTRTVSQMFEEFNLDQREFTHCMESQSVRLQVERDVFHARALELAGTPSTVFVNTNTLELDILTGVKSQSVYESYFAKYS